MSNMSPALTPQEASGSGSQSPFMQFASRNARLLAPLLTLIVLVIFFSITTDVFLTVRNLRNVITQVAPIAVAATGVTFVLLCAEIDLSIASIATFAGMLAAWFWVGDPISLGSWGILVGILVAALLGLINGFFISYVGIPSFMMTLAMLTIGSGLATYINQGKPIFEVPTITRTIARANNLFLGLPVMGYIAIAVLIVGHIILAYTRFGRQVYMTGGNREAAQMSGVDTRRVIMLVMMISGLTAGMAGILFIGRLSQANPAGGQNMLIDTIAAVVLGGTSLFGGEGGMLNTVLGLLIFAVLSNGLNLLPNLNIYFKEALTGIILLCALLLNVLALRLETFQRRTE
ncbi:MAG: ABC transporter permease [Thermomicrobiales bacterium]|nr:ABC transporter permease [Thermomicrobiales bacterium]MCO5222045.1 ABC transporter permease [Thermomicrobiales bacterium]